MDESESSERGSSGRMSGLFYPAKREAKQRKEKGVVGPPDQGTLRSSWSFTGLAGRKKGVGHDALDCKRWHVILETPVAESTDGTRTKHAPY
eukprot:CAMPEP_0195007774 /NCGR_PEP_ID=MMETSP0326_2-20130528/7920_1 /TAXON_ID=2866 ORGANISM="Crypthecodinium cohnii, Strain Seligo" /NCGR_SAMPLE_ID=MMETSP0326_2 /ASSEMBLY_ACC=CAM_ASM_000348 /LENGTH=91 /DNA_ID=CAMNT_0040015315 /DNA_START=42 /DNA_END=314 /DNA_ORIENTATION=+